MNLLSGFQQQPLLVILFGYCILVLSLFLAIQYHGYQNEYLFIGGIVEAVAITRFIQYHVARLHGKLLVIVDHGCSSFDDIVEFPTVVMNVGTDAGSRRDSPEIDESPRFTAEVLMPEETPPEAGPPSCMYTVLFVSQQGVDIIFFHIEYTPFR